MTGLPADSSVGKCVAELLVYDKYLGIRRLTRYPKTWKIHEETEERAREKPLSGPDPARVTCWLSQRR